MKIQFLFKSLPIALFVLLTVVSLSAQKPTKTTRPANPAQMEASDEAADAEMEKSLKLTPSQKAEFKKTNEAYKAQAKASKAESKEERQKLREERDRARRAVLTPEQAKQYDAMRAKRMERHQEKKAERSARKGERKAGQQEMKKAQKAEKKGKRSGNKVTEEETEQ